MPRKGQPSDLMAALNPETPHRFWRSLKGMPPHAPSDSFWFSASTRSNPSGMCGQVPWLLPSGWSGARQLGPYTVGRILQEQRQQRQEAANSRSCWCNLHCTCPKRPCHDATGLARDGTAWHGISSKAPAQARYATCRCGTVYSVDTRDRLRPSWAIDVQCTWHAEISR